MNSNFYTKMNEFDKELNQYKHIIWLKLLFFVQNV